MIGKMRKTAWLLILAAACSGEPGEPPPPDVDPMMIVGAGPDDGSPGFISVDDDVQLTLHPGAQGGFHVYVNLRFATNMEKPLIQRDVRRVDTMELVSRSKHTAELEPAPGDAEGFDTKSSIPVFLCPSPVGIQVAEMPLVLEVTAGETEDDPNPLEDTLRFTPVCPAEHEEFCRRICFG